MPPIKSKAHINVDLGEAYGNLKCGPDEELFPFIDQANIACGFQYSFLARIIHSHALLTTSAYLALGNPS